MSEHLDKGNLYDRLNQAIQQTRELVVSMEGLQKVMTQVLEENAALSIENDHLRRLLESQSQKDAGGLTASQKKLQKIYEEGFHICHEYYGKRRDDECLFCQSALNPRKKGK